jgi:ribosomal protein S18 acetylase RimI-like enzyme
VSERTEQHGLEVQRSLEVRRASGPAEIAAAGRVVAAAYETDDFASADYRSRLGQAQDRADNAELLVAVDADGAVLGSVTYSLAGQPYAEVSRPGEAEFRMLGVDPRARGRGVGEALVQACLDRARRDGATAMAICTMPEMTSAQGIYTRLGFVRDPERDWRPIPSIQLLGFLLQLGRPPDESEGSE